jgi:uncharacterized protein YdcH (DUF465 family)
LDQLEPWELLGVRVDNPTDETRRELIDQLTAQHKALKERIRELEKHLSLTSEEREEYARLKKLKLRTKDQLQLLQAN